MALDHAGSAQVVSVRPLAAELGSARTTALLKARQLEVMRVVLQAGQTLREHRVPGEITVQCLEGRLEIATPDAVHLLEPGDFVYLDGGVAHALRAVTSTSALVTICLFCAPAAEAAH